MSPDNNTDKSTSSSAESFFSRMLKQNQEHLGIGGGAVLLVVAILAFFLKGWVGFQLEITLLISVFTALIFYGVIKDTTQSSFKWVILLLFVLDVFLYAAGRFSLSFLPDMFVAIMIWVWIVLGIILFLWALISQRPALGIVALIATVIAAILIFYPAFFSEGASAQTFNTQAQALQQYQGTAEKFAEKAEKAYEDTSNNIGDYAGCYLQVSADKGVSSEKCLEEKKARRYCKEIYPDNDDEEEKCVQEKITGKGPVAVKVTSTREPIKLEPSFDKNFYTPGKKFISQRFPLLITYKNPLQEDVIIKTKCNFSGTLKQRGQEIEGVTKPAEIKLKDGKKEDRIRINCEPKKELEGTYELKFEVIAENLVTDARLTRFFIGEKSEEEEKNTLAKVMLKVFGTKISDETVFDIENQLEAKYGKAEVPDDLAQLGFGFGNPTTESVVVRGTDGLEVVFSAKNEGQGKIMTIQRYFMTQQAFTSTCSDSNAIRLPESKLKQKSFTLASCDVTSLAANLENPENYEPLRMEAAMIYDYKFEKKQKIDVVKGK